MGEIKLISLAGLASWKYWNNQTWNVTAWLVVGWLVGWLVVLEGPSRYI